MNREQIISLRDEAFNSIALAYQTCGPVATWSADQRMALTMTQLVYHAACTQLAQVESDAMMSKLICLLDAAKGALLDVQYSNGLSYEDTQAVRLGIVEALDLLES